MWWRRSAVIAGHELRLLRREVGLTVQLVFTPIVMIAFLKPAFAPALVAAGARSANGSEQAVPGMVVMFSFFSAGVVGFAFFREHGWHTWDRLRASQARTLEIIAGKVAPAVLLTLCQQAVLFLAGVLLFGLAIRGSLVALAAVSAALTLTFVAVGVALAAWLKSAQQLNAVSGVAAMVLTGLGGAFAPLSVLPGWARAVAPVTPTYWAMQGYRTVILSGGGTLSTLRPVAVLLLFTAAITAFASGRFRVDEAKRFNG
ncbi:MAG: ABC transporter permease [Mycobacteriales bacterium]